MSVPVIVTTPDTISNPAIILRSTRLSTAKQKTPSTTVANPSTHHFHAETAPEGQKSKLPSQT